MLSLIYYKGNYEEIQKLKRIVKISIKEIG